MGFRTKKHVLFSVLLVLSVLSKQEVEGQLTFAKVDTLGDAIRYLFKFGYLKNLNEVASLLSPSITSLDPYHPAASTLRLAFSKFQQYAKLPVTGNFDKPTKDKMNSPRCGNKDILQVNTSFKPITTLLRKKRFVTSPFKWQKRELTYRVAQFSDGPFSPEITLREVDQAFAIWGNVTDLEFLRQDNTQNVDIELKFARLAHGDIEPFDGRGITLAHAFPPGPDIGGDIHFDDDEEWTSNSYEGTNFIHVVVHELGHALGLRHSDVEDAIMYAFAKPYDPKLRLHVDDIEGIQALYGARRTTSDNGGSFEETSTEMPKNTSSSSTPTSGTVEGESDKPDLCQNATIDAIVTLGDDSVYAFKGAYAFKISSEGKGILYDESDKIDKLFPGLPANIDAALTYRGNTYFFKGSYFWRFSNQTMDLDYPRLISRGFPGIPNDIDAALTWSGDGIMYFFKGDQYWGFDPTSRPAVLKIYPLPISQWYDLPDRDIDGAFTSPIGPTYFFKGENYWLFDDDNFQVAESDPPYPRPTRVMWLGCTNYRPDTEDLRRGWLGRAINKIKQAVKSVAAHLDAKVRRIGGWIGVI